MLDTRLVGGAQLRQLAATMRAEGRKGLAKEMAAGLRRAARPLQAAIRDEFEKVLPSRGGYRAVASKSVRFRTAVRTGNRDASFRITTYVDGKKERRDIRALDAGQLRHPVYGRSRPRRGGGRQPNPWAVTRIQAGFFRRGTDRAADDAERQMTSVLNDYASRLLKG